MSESYEHTQQAFIELYGGVDRRLMSYFARRVHDNQAAAELWSECWAVAYENWRHCRADSEGSAEAWLFGIARNLLASYYRRGRIRRRALDRLRWRVPIADGALDEELERVVDREALRQAFAEALDTLPPRRRRAVKLRIVDGLDYSALADQLNCSEQAARAHVSRGLKQLAKVLDRRELYIVSGEADD